jgi:hypothetical protein
MDYFVVQNVFVVTYRILDKNKLGHRPAKIASLLLHIYSVGDDTSAVVKHNSVFLWTIQKNQHIRDLVLSILLTV